MTRLSDEIKKPRLKSTQKYIKNLIKNQNFLGQDPEKGEPVTPYMDVYKAKIQYDKILDKLKLRIVVTGDLQNKELVGDTWSPTVSMINSEYFLTGTSKHKARVTSVIFYWSIIARKR